MRNRLPSRVILVVSLLVLAAPLASAQAVVPGVHAALFHQAGDSRSSPDSPPRGEPLAPFPPGSSIATVTVSAGTGSGLASTTLERQEVRLLAREPARPLAGPMLAMYGGMVAVHALDAHSTFRALDGGHAEGNPMMRWLTGHPAGFVAVKAAATAATVYCAEQIRKKHPRRALIFMAAVNAAYAGIVIHNYRAGTARH
jgi:hypothetical protein